MKASKNIDEFDTNYKEELKMKKIIIGIISSAIILSAATASAFALSSDNFGKNYTDADNDGVCDNIGTLSSNGSGVGYVDADNDGICDNKGTGNAYGNGGNGAGYVDADNDGICDNRGTGCGNGNGRCRNK